MTNRQSAHDNKGQGDVSEAKPISGQPIPAESKQDDRLASTSSASTGAHGHAAPSIAGGQRAAMMAVLLFGSFTALMAETFLNNALPTIMGAFGVTQAAAQWLTTAYLLVVGLMIPMSAWVFESFNLRTTFVTLMAVFFVGSLVCVFAPNFWVLLAGRIVEAAAAGGLMPFIQNVILMMFPPDKRGLAMGVTGLVIGFGPAVGPTISGLILKVSGFRTLFAILAAASVVAVLLALPLVRNITSPARGTTDVISFAESILGFGLMLYALSEVGNTGHVTLVLAVAFVLGVAIMALFCVRQLRLAKPLLDVRVFANVRFDLCTLLSTISNIAMVGIELVLPLYLQTTRGESALTSGLVMMPGALVMVACNPISGVLYDRLGIRRLSLFGFVMLLAGSVPMLWFSAKTSLALIGLCYALRMVGISFTMMTTFTAGINMSAAGLAAHANAASSTVRQIGGSLGTALAMLVISLAAVSWASAGRAAAQAIGYNWGFILMVVFALIGLVASCFLPGASAEHKAVAAASR
ncbi:DHA2 family efflux MFS transporter permease subunit [Bifidobacterium sp. ESL0763]|uniref:DHA2 family efflux MFS transporter permease subunit n=1 Tax=Bifidobacterium sp. ESL0763 TaxID=2983227 RepID=UPI0023F92833|nr:DHA2 family efflux MFS transporter permease subunit [Bifidobacterium sp. ESL0763]MDF7664335.1 DHA2 family efflux MFS transporter permease subunit [Bifidobacterium sp. ESL0763]